MIAGIIAQEGAAVPRGALLAPDCHLDASFDLFSFPVSYAPDSVEGVAKQ